MVFSTMYCTMGDFKVGVSVRVYCTKCTLNTGVNTNFEITHCIYCVTNLFYVVEGGTIMNWTITSDFVCHALLHMAIYSKRRYV
jgi:hypothetical protein